MIKKVLIHCYPWLWSFTGSGQGFAMNNANLINFNRFLGSVQDEYICSMGAIFLGEGIFVLQFGNITVRLGVGVSLQLTEVNGPSFVVGNYYPKDLRGGVKGTNPT